jgi:hypothetical protein
MAELGPHTRLRGITNSRHIGLRMVGVGSLLVLRMPMERLAPP